MKEKKTDRIVNRPFLLDDHMPVENRFWFLLWHLALLALACGILTCFTLLLSYSNLNPEIWKGFWENLWIPLMNLALIYCLCLVLYVLAGRAWLAFLLTAVIALGIALGNYYLIIIRTDPFKFQDITCLREALTITGVQGYELDAGPRVLLSVVGSIGVVVLLALLSRWKPRWRWYRLILLALALGLLAFSFFVGKSSRMYKKTANSHVNTWSSTEIYASRGVIYSFARSMQTASGKPAGYSEKDTEEYLRQFRDEDIPDTRKVDVFVIMRESYADLSELDCDRESLDFSCYDLYHQLVEESVLVGNLVTNGFGGNTKDAERCFLTGYYTTWDWRKPTNSYVWYLNSQGYRTEGAHPFNGWFYNRLNINRYLGFDRYDFREDTFDALVGEEEIASDDVLYDELWRMYGESDPSVPYFSFSVTYEGHGPYVYHTDKYPNSYVLRDAESNDGHAMNNYLGLIRHRDEELMALVERFRSCDRPVVLLLYGDHKATLGKDINNYTTAAYEHYGINVDLSTADGFFNYYSTDYVIWMNDAARETLGVQGEVRRGPSISPCYLMNVLFDTLDWGKGPAYLQAMREMMDVFPIFSTKGRYSVDGELVSTLPEEYLDSGRLLRSLSYYEQTNFHYQALSETGLK